MSQTQFKQVNTVLVDTLCPLVTATPGAIKPAVNDTTTGTPGGLAVITYNGGVGAFTLAAPKAGGPAPQTGTVGTQPAAEGDDGKMLTILATNVQLHVITLPAHAINGNKNTLTNTAVLGNNITLQAYNGVWYVVGNLGWTLGGA